LQQLLQQTQKMQEHQSLLLVSMKEHLWKMQQQLRNQQQLWQQQLERQKQTLWAQVAAMGEGLGHQQASWSQVVCQQREVTVRLRQLLIIVQKWELQQKQLREMHEQQMWRQREYLLEELAKVKAELERLQQRDGDELRAAATADSTAAAAHRSSSNSCKNSVAQINQLKEVRKQVRFADNNPQAGNPQAEFAEQTKPPRKHRPKAQFAEQTKRAHAAQHAVDADDADDADAGCSASAARRRRRRRQPQDTADASDADGASASADQAEQHAVDAADADEQGQRQLRRVCAVRSLSRSALRCRFSHVAPASQLAVPSLRKQLPLTFGYDGTRIGCIKDFGGSICHCSKTESIR